MRKCHEINGLVYRVKTLKGSFLVECDAEYADEQLVDFCSDLSLEGHHITSVTRIFADSSDTPRIAVLSTTEYRAVLDKKIKDKEKENG